MLTRDALLAENAQLRQDLAAARVELAGLRAAQEHANERIAELAAQVGKLSEAVATGNDRLAELAAAATRNKRASEPPRPPAPPPVTPVPIDPDDPLAHRPQPPVLPPKEKPAPKPRRPTGRNPLPAHLPAVESTAYPDHCPCGCREFDLVDEVVEEKLHVVREHQRRRVVRRKTGRCRNCNRRVTGQAPPAPFPRSKVTCDWLAWLVVQKFFYLVPLDRIRRGLGLAGVHLSISFLVSQIARAADLLDAVDGEHWKNLKAGPWMQSDGTGLKVIVPKLPGTHRGYIEVYRRGDTVVFQYEAEKSAATVTAKLKGYRGILLVDAEHRYNELFSVGNATEAGCNAHGRRKFEDAEPVQPVLAAEGGRFLSAVFAAEAESRERGLAGDALRTWRQERERPIFDDFRRWMDVVEPRLLPSDALAGAIRYYRNHWAALTLFLDRPEIPPDNSGSEREFQTVAKARLSWLFAGSTEGAHRAAVLLGIVATCRNLGIDAQAYMTWAFERVGTHAQHYGLAAAQLTPAAYKREVKPFDTG